MRVGIVALLAAVLTACGSSGSGSAQRIGSGGAIRIVAAENFWGSIASQVGAGRVQVRSIIDNPDTDPHEYEPTASDARALAGADIVIVNGLGYDAWAEKLLAASPGSRTVINVGDLIGAKSGDNPHRWYNPGDVRAVIRTLTADLKRLAPADAVAIERSAHAFTTSGLKRYDDLIASIKRRYAGTRVGASESIFAMLSPSLGLSLITPPSLLKAVSEGTDVSAADKLTADRQIKDHEIAIYVYNSQNATPDIQAQLKECRDNGIPTATVTETMEPAGGTYQSWQAGQLRGIEAALAKASAS